MERIPEEKYNSEQRATVAEFVKLQARLDELIERHRAQLNTELVRLAGELRALAAAHDDRVSALAAKREGVAAALAALELYATRLLLSVSDRARSVAADAAVVEGEAPMISDEYACAAALSDFAQAVAAHESAADALAAADKAADRTFRATLTTHISDELNLAPPEAPVMRELVALFRKRAPGVTAAAAVAGLGAAAVSSDAETTDALAAEAARAAFLRPLTVADVSDGFDSLVTEPYWPRIVALRAAKLDSELAVADAARTTDVLAKHVASLTARFETAKRALDDVDGSKRAARAARDLALHDVEMLVRLKMGQDEVSSFLPYDKTAADGDFEAHPLGGDVEPDVRVFVCTLLKVRGCE